MKEALKVKLEALDNETGSDNNSETFDDSHSPQSQYSVPDNVEHSESHKPAGSESQSQATITSDTQDSRPSESDLAPSLEPDAELSNASRAPSDNDTGYFTPAVDHREIKVEAITESEMDLEMTSAVPGKNPSSSENLMSNIQDMIGSIPAASRVTSQGEISQDAPHHRNSKYMYVISFLSKGLDSSVVLYEHLFQVWEEAGLNLGLDIPTLLKLIHLSPEIGSQN